MQASSLANQPNDGYLWQLGRVTEVSGLTASIEFERLPTCAKCASGKGCGQGVFSQLFSRRSAQLTLQNTQGLRVGQWVKVGVTPRAVLNASLLLYGWPLLLFLLVLVTGHYGLSLGQSAWGEWTLFGAALGIAAIGLRVAGHLRIKAMNPIVKGWTCPEEPDL